MTNKVTSKQVAELAGVSQATVSYVLNNKEGKRISESTRQAVLDAAQQLGYVPNVAAQRLKTSHSNCIAVRLATNLSIERYYMALQGIRAYFEPRGYNLILFNDKIEGSRGNYLTACLNTLTDGVLYISADFSGIPDDELEILRKYRIPVSAIDCMNTVPDVASIVYDYYACTALPVQYLLSKGLRKFVYLRPDLDNFKERDRERGFVTPLQDYPDAEYKIERFSSTISGNDSIIGGTAISHLNTAFYGSFSERYREVIRKYGPDTAFITSFPEHQEIVSQLLYEEDLLHPDNPVHWWERSVSITLSHYEIGFEAARSLYGIINGTGSIRKLSIQPLVGPYTESALTLNGRA